MDNVVASIVQEYKQWMLGATRSRTVVKGKARFSDAAELNFDLKNRIIVRYLQHEEQKFGVNLGWTDDATNQTGQHVARWFFTKKNGKQEPILYGETIALANGGEPSFLKFEHRTVGINLGWSDLPSFEWMLLGGKIGTPVSTQDWLAIYNSKSEGGECMIYFDRTVGGDIGWPSSSTWTDQLKGLAWEKVRREALDYMKKFAGV